MTDYTVGDTVHFMFTTRRFTTGAPFALASGVISAYENESLTQITAGITLGVDHDGITGLNLVTVVASGANGFESGKDYHLVVTTGTVDSVSIVGEVVGRFTLGRSAAAVDLANATDGLGAIKTDTAAILVDTGTTLDGKIDAIDTVVDAILVDTAEIGSAGAGLTNINLPDQTMNIIGNITGNLSGSIGSIGTSGITTASFASGAINAAAIATDAIGSAELAASAIAEIADGVWDEILSGHVVAGSAGEALASAGTAGDPWTTLLPGAYGPGTAGKIIGDNIDATISTRATQTSVDTVDANVDAILVDTSTTLQAELDGIQADTEDIQSRLPATLVTGRMDASVGVMAANVITAGATAPDFTTEVQAGLATAASVAALPAATATEVLDQADGVEVGVTVREHMKYSQAALAGKADGLGTTTVHYRDTADAINRITATVDADGNRSAVILNPT